jgi:predicted ATPase/DNA-binding SARP family transcriptional activator
MLSLNLLGAPAIELDGTPITHFRSTKVLALLAYLGVESSVPHQREALATLLWPDYPSSRAMRNFSQTLTRLRRAVNDTEQESHFFEITRQTLRLSRGGTVACDLWRFGELLACCDQHEHDSLEHCGACQARLKEAAALARGDLLEGFSVPDSITFDEWLLLSREFWHERQLAVLDLVATGALVGGRNADAIRYAHRQIALEPWRERAHQQLMRALALDDQRAAALAQYERFKRLLADELGVDPSQATHELYEKIRDGALTAPPRSATIDSRVRRIRRRSTLPTPSTRFFGREMEVQELEDQLRGEGYRILTIQGPGGIGKTRLALEVARRQVNHFSDGVFFVPLAGVERVDDLPTAITRAMHLPISGHASPSEQILTFLAERHVLLVLDNFEHLMDAVPWLLHLLTNSARVLLLVTSREQLNVMAEDLYSLSGLPVPPLDASLEEAAASPAVHLFVDRAHRIEKSFSLSAGNYQQVTRICQLVDGLPLGIELAATWIRERSCQEIAESISTNLDFLVADLRDLPHGHRSLRAVFEHSWQLLTPEEQVLLARLSLFRGGFTRAAAEQVAEATALQINRLRHKSLVRVGGTDRLVMHELVRQFALGKLEQDPEAAALARSRHSTLYLDLLMRNREALYQEAPHEAAAEISRDLDNVRAAWHHAVEGGGQALRSPAVQALGRLYRLLGYFEEGITLFDEAAAMTRRHLHGAPPSDDDAHILLSQLLLEQVRCGLRRALVTTDYLAILDEARAHAREAGGHCQELEAHVLEGRTRRLLGQMDEGLRVLSRVLAEIRRAGFRHLEAEALFELGKVYTNQTQVEQSNEYYLPALLIQTELKNRVQEQEILLNLAVNAILALDYAQGSTYLKAAAALSPATIAPTNRARITNARGFIEAALGNYPSALILHEESRAISQELGDSTQESHALHNLCAVHTLMGNLDAALEAGQAALDLAVKDQNPEPEACALTHLGFLYLAREEWASAGEALAGAQAGWMALGNQTLVMEPTAGLAALAQAAGDYPRAAHYAREVLEHVLDSGVAGTDVPFRIYLICYQVLDATGMLDEARQVLEKGCDELLAVARKIGDPETRHSFLNNVPPNRALLQSCEKSTRLKTRREHDLLQGNGGPAAVGAGGRL